MSKETVTHNVIPSQHEQLIRKIAEEMAKAYYKEKMEPVPGWYGKEFMYPRWEELTSANIEGVIESRFREARIAVEHMAAEYKAGYKKGENDGFYEERYGHTPDSLQSLLERRGLEPVPNQNETISLSTMLQKFRNKIECWTASNDRIYYIDYREESETYGRLYDGIPGADAVVVNQEFIKPAEGGNA